MEIQTKDHQQWPTTQQLGCSVVILDEDNKHDILSHPVGIVCHISPRTVESSPNGSGGNAQLSQSDIIQW
jgi:hypothetical protein